MELNRKTLEEVSLNDDATGSETDNMKPRIGALKLREVLQKRKSSNMFRLRSADSGSRSKLAQSGDVDATRKNVDVKTDARDVTPIDNTNKASRRPRDDAMTSSTRDRPAQTNNNSSTVKTDTTVASSNGGKSLESAKRALRARQKMLSFSTASERSFSTDSDPDIAEMMGFGDSGSRSLVEELLFDIYDRWHCSRRDSFDSDTLTGCSSTSDALGGRSDVMHVGGVRDCEARLNKASLESKGL